MSFIFDLLSSTAEEQSAFLAKVIDRAFAKTHSQLEAPNFFYKAIMLVGAFTIEDPKLKENVKFYTEECFEKIIPQSKRMGGAGFQDQFFGPGRFLDDKLQEIAIEFTPPLAGAGATVGPRVTNCLNIKNKIREDLIPYLKSKSSLMKKIIHSGRHDKTLSFDLWPNMQASSLLLFTWDGLLSLLGKQEYHGASMAVNRGQEFSDNLSRAPHVAGFIKLLLIMIFPFLVFFLVAGQWKVLCSWFLLYLSVLLWTPIWTLLYYILTNITLLAELMESFGQLHDGISLYNSAKIVTSRIYYLYSVYSWLQILIGPAWSALMLFMIRPMFADTKNESAPDFVGDSTSVLSSGAKILGG